MSSLREIKGFKILLSALFIAILSGCNESTTSIVEIEKSVQGTDSLETNVPSELNFTSEIQRNSSEFECDSVVTRPNEEMEYSGREINITEHFSFPQISPIQGQTGARGIVVKLGKLMPKMKSSISWVRFRDEAT